jgi:hypothetical protein
MYTVNWSKKAAKQVSRVAMLDRARIIESVGGLSDRENGWSQVKAL